MEDESCLLNWSDVVLFKHKRLYLLIYMRSEEIYDDAEGTDGMPHNIGKKSSKG